MEDSSIEWTHHTFNVAWGCSKVSPGCKNCYADALSRRYGFDVWGEGKPRRTMSAHYWAQPRKWDKKAAATGTRQRVFCSSMADVFESHPTVAQERLKLWKLIEETPNLDWLLLTKRPENIGKHLPVDWIMRPLSHVWLGTSLENDDYQERVFHLRQIPAAVRFISAEPLLGAIRPNLDGIHWVIAGGESGAKARPMHPDWARSLRDQCREEGVAFFFKQWGEWAPVATPRLNYKGTRLVMDSQGNSRVATWGDVMEARGDGWGFEKHGKKESGRLLDGRTWDEFPVAQAIERA